VEYLSKVNGLQVRFQRFDGLGHGPLFPASLSQVFDNLAR
jgi:hypothetical protein